MSDLISREALRKAFHERIWHFDKSSWDEANSLIDNAPIVEPFERIGAVCNENCGIYRPQGEFVEILKDRIEKSICLHCRMYKHCELCEISRVFLLIALTDKEMKGGEG